MNPCLGTQYLTFLICAQYEQIWEKLVARVDDDHLPQLSERTPCSGKTHMNKEEAGIFLGGGTGIVVLNINCL